nr:hypothetical protein CFP56_08010 [Quercus suber]
MTLASFSPSLVNSDRHKPQGNRHDKQSIGLYGQHDTFPHVTLTAPAWTGRLRCCFHRYIFSSPIFLYSLSSSTHLPFFNFTTDQLDSWCYSSSLKAAIPSLSPSNCDCHAAHQPQRVNMRSTAVYFVMMASSAVGLKINLQRFSEPNCPAAFHNNSSGQHDMYMESNKGCKKFSPQIPFESYIADVVKGSDQMADDYCHVDTFESGDCTGPAFTIGGTSNSSSVMHFRSRLTDLC